MELVGLSAFKATYIQHLGDDLLVAKAARVTTANDTTSLGEREKKLIKFLGENRHTSPFEMCDMTLLIECPIFIARQFHRHRTFAYNEWSGMYSKVGESFYIPSKFYCQPKRTLEVPSTVLNEKKTKEMINLMEYHCIKSYEYYEKLLVAGVTKDLARILLPQNMMTKFWAKANLVNWVRYCSLRMPDTAHYEHQYLAKKVFKEVLSSFPISTGALARGFFDKELLKAIGINNETD